MLFGNVEHRGRELSVGTNIWKWAQRQESGGAILERQDGVREELKSGDTPSKFCNSTWRGEQFGIGKLEVI